LKNSSEIICHHKSLTPKVIFYVVNVLTIIDLQFLHKSLLTPS